ncbi:MAG: DUF309 domain-containing protein [Caldithrix sp.]|nr:MAG: DUF309 domain-containing protein [Caldithrix sp.]
MHDERFAQAIHYFNNRYFFEAHDVFEEIWMEERGRSRRFYQGLVQLATGFYHLSMKNLNGAASQLSKGVEKLNIFKPAFAGLELENLLREITECLAELKKQHVNSLSSEAFKMTIPKLTWSPKNIKL